MARKQRRGLLKGWNWGGDCSVPSVGNEIGTGWGGELSMIERLSGRRRLRRRLRERS
jgi:hypothetical protein